MAPGTTVTVSEKDMLPLSVKSSVAVPEALGVYENTYLSLWPLAHSAPTAPHEAVAETGSGVPAGSPLTP